MVGTGGIEPPASSASRKRSPTELRAYKRKRMTVKTEGMNFLCILQLSTIILASTTILFRSCKLPIFLSILIFSVNSTGPRIGLDSGARPDPHKCTEDQRLRWSDW